MNGTFRRFAVVILAVAFAGVLSNCQNESPASSESAVPPASNAPGDGSAAPNVPPAEPPANPPPAGRTADSHTPPMTVAEVLANFPTNWSPSVVLAWNAAALAVIRVSPPWPTVMARRLFLLHWAIYEAWAAYHGKSGSLLMGAVPVQPPAMRTDANRREAISFAAHAILSAMFDSAAARAHFDDVLADLGYAQTKTHDLSSPAGIGNAIASWILVERANDGSNAVGNYADMISPTYQTLYSPVNSADPSTGRVPGEPNFDPNRWQPLRVPTGALLDTDGRPVVDPNDPATYVDQRFLTPQWGAVDPFALSSGSQFRPGSPPMLGSTAIYTDAKGHVSTGDEAYRAQVAEVLAITATLTDYQKAAAEYWADGPHTETPPGHWNLFAQAIAYRDLHTLEADVKLFFILNAALFDASIACWDAKRAYDFIRPISAIRHLYAGQIVPGPGSLYEDAAWIPAENWHPYQSRTFVTPAFPEYVSGHSTFSAAAAMVLARFTGSERLFDPHVRIPFDHNDDGFADRVGEYVLMPGGFKFEAGPVSPVTLRWDTFADAAAEAGRSRIYGGIHISDSDLRGRQMGREIGTVVMDRAEAIFAGSP